MLQQHPGVAGDYPAGLAPLGEIHRALIVNQPLRRPENQRQRRAQLVADVGEELRLDLVEFADPLSSPCSSMFFAAISRSCAFFSVMSRPSAAINTTFPSSSVTGIRDASMMIVSEPPSRP